MTSKKRERERKKNLPYFSYHLNNVNTCAQNLQQTFSKSILSYVIKKKKERKKIIIDKDFPTSIY